MTHPTPGGLGGYYMLFVRSFVSLPCWPQSGQHGIAGREAGRTARPRTTTHDRPRTHDRARPRMTDHARTTTHDHTRPRTTDRARPRTTTHYRPRTHDRARPRTTDHARPRTTDHGCHICLRKRYLPHPRGVYGVKLSSSTRVSEGTNA